MSVRFIPLPGMEEAAPRCFDCGEFIPPSERVEIWDSRWEERNKGFLCEDCREDYVRCSACGILVHKEDVMEGPDGEPYCPACFEDRFYICAGCGEPIPIGEEFWSPNDEPYHEECARGVFNVCSVCGETVWEEETYWDDDGNAYCYSCYQEHAVSIHEYGYKPSPVFHKLRHENTVYIGIELEVAIDGRREAASELQEMDPEEKMFYLKEDSSISWGFEIVTHPFTWKAHHQEFRWAEFLTELRSLGADPDDTCGLHVHISRNALPEGPRGWGKVLLLFDKMRETLREWSERSNPLLNQWAQFWSREEIEAYLWRGSTNAYRYRAVNFTSRTVEIRIWAATLEHKKIVAIIQFADAIVEFARWVSAAFLYRADPDTVRALFLNFLKIHGYHHAWESLKEVA